MRTPYRLTSLLVVIICLAALYLALPSFLLRQGNEAWRQWLPSRTVNLGLDLQGGAHLLLEIDFDAYYRQQLQSLTEELRKMLREKRIGYHHLRADAGGITFQLRDASQRDKVKEQLREYGADLLVTVEDGQFHVVYTDPYVLQLKQKLLEQSIEIIRRRVDETGTKELSLQRQGANRILLQVPGLQNPEEIKRLLGKTAQLTFHLLEDPATQAEAETSGRVPPGARWLPSEDKLPNGKQQQYLVKKQVMLSGDSLVDARASVQQGTAVVDFRFNTMGGRKFGEITEANVGRPFAIVLDGKVLSAPVIREPIFGGRGQISGSFTVESANELALLLRAGALPTPLKIVEERTVGPSLGADSIVAGTKASIIGTVAVMVMMVVVYGLFGFFASIAVVFNLVMVIAALALLQATLTLPGIAGMALTVGMSVDANVLIFERIKEELRLGKTNLAAIESGFKNAFATITDSNVTTLIAAVLLLIYGTGPVKGFGVTLFIGIVCSMFTALTLTRLMIDLWYYHTHSRKSRLAR